MIAFLLALLIKRAGWRSAFPDVYAGREYRGGVLRNVYKLERRGFLPEEVTDRLIPQPYLKVLIRPQEAARWEHLLPVYLVVGAVYLVHLLPGGGQEFPEERFVIVRASRQSVVPVRSQ
jgi:hypothetical protein